MKQSYYLFSPGTLKRKDNSITLEKSDGSKSDIPVERIDDLFIFGDMQYNSQLFAFLGSKGIPVHMFNYYDFYVGSFYPREVAVSGKLLVKQVEHYSDEAKRLIIAKEFVMTATDNIYRNLRYYNSRNKDVQKQMDDISLIKQSMPNVVSVQELMGYEGVAHQIYYSAFNTVINQDIDFQKRVKRPPDNMINTLISYCNSLVYTKVLSQIYCTQLNPTISYLHQPGQKRFSLCLDIAEVFKPLIADRMIFSMLNHNQITQDDFDEELGYLRIKDKGIRTIVAEFDKRMKTTIMHKDLNREVSYQHLIRLECYKLIKHLLNEKPYEGFRIWW
ncbi:MAG: type I-B CRISPR-associated endonuclease Cas1b [Oscillospiraceae bacterium]